MNFDNYTKRTIILKFLLFFALTSCSNDDRIIPNSPPGTFTVNVSEVSGNEANLSWTANDPNGDILQYSIVLNNQEITSSLSEPSYTFTNLLPNTGYNGRVVATDAENNSTSSDFSFMTINVPYMQTFEISNMTLVSGEVRGKLLNSGSTDVEEVGLVIHTSPLPTYENNLDKYKLQLDNENEFHKIVYLTPGRTYYIRAYGLNQEGIGYGNEVQYVLPDESEYNGIIVGSIVKLLNQEDVNTFGALNINRITGSVIISGNVNDLSPLSSLATIEGSFTVQNTRNLVGFSGLENLKTIGNGFYIEKNTALQNFQGLNGLKDINGDVEISNNNVLMDLQGLESVTSMGDLILNNNDALINLDNLNNLATADNIFIENNDNLNDLSGLQNLTNVSDIAIKNNNSLTSLQGFNNLSAVRSLRIENNLSLATLDGLENLNTVLYLYISHNDALVSIQGLSNLTILGNDNLNDLSGIRNLTNVSSLYINYSLLNLNNLNRYSATHGIIIHNNNMLSDFCGLKTLFESGGYNIILNISLNLENPTVNEIISKCN